MKFPQLILTSFVLASASVSHAAWVAVDNFQSLTVGALGTQNGWTTGGTSPGNAKVDLDPTNATNQVLFLDGDDVFATKSIPTIADGTTGTFFLRVYAASTGTTDAVFGLSDNPAATTFGDFEVQSGVKADSPTFDPYLRGRDSGSQQDPGLAMTNGVWYNIWMVVDNTNDNWKYWVEGGAWTTPTELFSITAGNTDWDFRNGVAANNITNFLAVTTNGSAGSKIYFDDLYVDTTGENLTGPVVVPEPSVALLGGLGLLGLLRRRRK